MKEMNENKLVLDELWKVSKDNLYFFEILGMKENELSLGFFRINERKEMNNKLELWENEMSKYENQTCR